MCVCLCVCIPGLERYCPPLPPWLADRTQTQREEQPAPPAGTADPLYWTPASHTWTCGANRRSVAGVWEGQFGYVWLKAMEHVKQLIYDDLWFYMFTTNTQKHDNTMSPNFEKISSDCTENHFMSPNIWLWSLVYVHVYCLFVVVRLDQTSPMREQNERWI